MAKILTPEEVEATFGKPPVKQPTIVTLEEMAAENELSKFNKIAPPVPKPLNIVVAGQKELDASFEQRELDKISADIDETFSQINQAMDTLNAMPELDGKSQQEKLSIVWDVWKSSNPNSYKDYYDSYIKDSHERRMDDFKDRFYNRVKGLSSETAINEFFEPEAREMAATSSSVVGGTGGGLGGAAIGAFLGGPVGAFLGMVIGSALGGKGGREASNAIYDAVTGYKEIDENPSLTKKFLEHTLGPNSADVYAGTSSPDESFWTAQYKDILGGESLFSEGAYSVFGDGVSLAMGKAFRNLGAKEVRKGILKNAGDYVSPEAIKAAEEAGLKIPQLYKHGIPNDAMTKLATALKESGSSALSNLERDNRAVLAQLGPEKLAEIRRVIDIHTKNKTNQAVTKAYLQMEEAGFKQALEDSMNMVKLTNKSIGPEAAVEASKLTGMSLSKLASMKPEELWNGVLKRISGLSKPMARSEKYKMMKEVVTSATNKLTQQGSEFKNLAFAKAGDVKVDTTDIDFNRIMSLFPEESALANANKGKTLGNIVNDLSDAPSELAIVIRAGDDAKKKLLEKVPFYDSTLAKYGTDPIAKETIDNINNTFSDLVKAIKQGEEAALQDMTGKYSFKNLDSLTTMVGNAMSKERDKIRKKALNDIYWEMRNKLISTAESEGVGEEYKNGLKVFAKRYDYESKSIYKMIVNDKGMTATYADSLYNSKGLLEPLLDMAKETGKEAEVKQIVARSFIDQMTTGKNAMELPTRFETFEQLAKDQLGEEYKAIEGIVDAYKNKIAVSGKAKESLAEFTKTIKEINNLSESTKNKVYSLFEKSNKGNIDSINAIIDPEMMWERLQNELQRDIYGDSDLVKVIGKQKTEELNNFAAGAMIAIGKNPLRNERDLLTGKARNLAFFYGITGNPARFALAAGWLGAKTGYQREMAQLLINPDAYKTFKLRGMTKGLKELVFKSAAEAAAASERDLTKEEIDRIQTELDKFSEEELFNQIQKEIGISNGTQ